MTWWGPESKVGVGVRVRCAGPWPWPAFLAAPPAQRSNSGIMMEMATTRHSITSTTLNADACCGASSNTESEQRSTEWFMELCVECKGLVHRTGATSIADMLREIGFFVVITGQLGTKLIPTELDAKLGRVCAACCGIRAPTPHLL